MNERIKKLLEQSGLQPYYDAQEGHIEKFAELIVTECIEMSNLEAAHYRAQADEAKSKQAFDYEFNSAATCLGVGLRIRKHFGVEE